jgi:transposase
MQIHSVGIDLGKTTFHLVALGAAGKVLVKKKFTQKQLLVFAANLQTSLIGLEACSGAHFLCRALRKQGHDVRLIPAQFVKPFVKSNKNDFRSTRRVQTALPDAMPVVPRLSRRSFPELRWSFGRPPSDGRVTIKSNR